MTMNKIAHDCVADSSNNRIRKITADTGLGRNFLDEFKEGGCVNAFGKAFNEGGSSPILSQTCPPVRV